MKKPTDSLMTNPLYAYKGECVKTKAIRFLADKTYKRDDGSIQSDQQIFDQILTLINNAQSFIYLDFFLFNDFSTTKESPHRKLQQQIKESLINKKQRCPNIEIILVTDPINTVYGGIKNQSFKELQASNIHLVITNLDSLNDSNPFYSFLWNPLFKQLGNSERHHLANPFGGPKVSLRSYLKLLNFKANHRKLIITDAEDTWQAVVTSANPHDESSAHHNTAVQFEGIGARELLASELPIICNSVNKHSPIPRLILQEIYRIDKRLACNLDITDNSIEQTTKLTLQVLGETSIKQFLITEINQLEKKDKLSFAMFYLSDRDVIASIKAASYRGTNIRILLDPNKDAFGFKKNGIPNRQVAMELHRKGVNIRWCDTHGEQFHTKLSLIQKNNGRAIVIAGSANLTRRNLDNFNLETNVAIYGECSHDFFNQVSDYFTDLWDNPRRIFSVKYEHYADENLAKWWLYRIMERTGICTF